ncbi:MAG: AAA family ATPase [Bacteroidales bacterium]|nr:AAA family ATPase [Bacteroidales bacterium]
MLTNIKLSNFRIHKSTNINISNRFVALVGKNDVGKSSVLEALDILCNSEINFENAYLKGEDRINNIHFFEQRENRDLESLIINKSLAEISTKCNEILARFDQYSNLEKNKDIAYLWEQYLNSFGSIDINLAKRGSGFKRLCEIYYFIMRSLAEYSNGPIILAVEEPEISLHPSQQRDIVNRLQDILNLPNTQVIISTHSPYIVNELKISSITVLKRKTDSQGNELDEIEPNPLNDRLLKKPLLCEINYLAFEVASYDYHIALFGLMINLINTKFGFCDIEHIDSKCLKNEPFKSLTSCHTYFRTGKDEELIVRKPAETDPLKRYVNDDYSLQYCVRNYIDHPHEINSDFGKMNIVETSIKQMINIITELKKLPD